MTIKKLIYKRIPYIPKLNLAIDQKLYPWVVKRNRKKVIEALRNEVQVYANIGAGGAGLAIGWVNIDYTQCKNVHYIFDCRKELPFAANSVKGIFTEHFFEHIDFNEEVPYFLKEAHRVLQSDGCIRIIVPDAEKYLTGYCSDGWESLKQTRPLNKNLTDSMGIKYNTKMELINEVFRQGGEHKYAWDYDTLKYVLETAGFSRISKRTYLESIDSKLAIDMEARKFESLYVEAMK